jgi:hypothetical protein
LMLTEKYFDEFFSILNIDPFAGEEPLPEKIEVNLSDLVHTVKDMSLAQSLAITWIRTRSDLNKYDEWQKQQRGDVDTVIAAMREEDEAAREKTEQAEESKE